MDTIPITRADTPLRFDDRPVPRRVGLVVLATDHSSEPDFRRMVAGETVGVYTARIPYANPTTPENLRRMQPRLEEGAALILPGEDLDVAVYSCTSASVVMGDEAVEQAIRAAKPGVPVLTPPSAARLGLKAFGSRRIAVLTPYTEETARPMAAYFAGHGFDIARFTYLGLDDDREMARIAPDSLVQAAVEATPADAEALFVSCTALRSALVARRIEEAIGRPVVTSNQATAWAALRLCGDGRPRPEFGGLMTLPLPEGT